jgi:hypothetical protein
MSMISSAVVDQSRSIGTGSAATVPMDVSLAFAMTCVPHPRDLSK